MLSGCCKPAHWRSNPKAATQPTDAGARARTFSSRARRRLGGVWRASLQAPLPSHSRFVLLVGQLWYWSSPLYVSTVGAAAPWYCTSTATLTAAAAATAGACTAQHPHHSHVDKVAPELRVQPEHAMRAPTHTATMCCSGHSKMLYRLTITTAVTWLLCALLRSLWKPIGDSAVTEILLTRRRDTRRLATTCLACDALRSRDVAQDGLAAEQAAGADVRHAKPDARQLHRSACGGWNGRRVDAVQGEICAAHDSLSAHE